MNDPTFQAGPASLDAASTPPRQPSPPASWPARYAFITCWLRPAATTTRMAGVPLWRAFGIHSATALAVVLTAILLEFGLYREAGLSAADAIVVGFVTLGEEIAGSPNVALSLLALALPALGIELGVVVLALLVMPCGAAQEPVGDSVRHALRRVWLHTPIAVPVLVIGFVITETFSTAVYACHAEASAACAEQFPDPDPDPSAPAPTSAQQEAWRQRWECQERHPAGVAAAILQCVEVGALALLGAWVLWSLVRGLEAPRAIRPAEYPPTCRACGYNLTGVAVEGRCAECGANIADSLGESADPGCPWDRRAEVGRWRALWTTMIEGLARPRRLAGQLRILPARRGYLVVLVLVTLLIGLTPAGTSLLVWPLWSGAPYAGVAQFFGVSAGLGCVVMLVALVSIGLAASVAGWVAAKRAGRNVFRGTAQLAVYMSSGLVVAAWVLGLLIAGAIRMADELEQLSRALGWNPWTLGLLVVLSALGLAGLCIIAYVVRVSRAAVGLWYAPR